MRTLLEATAIALMLALTGCTSVLMGNALQQGRDLTPEQVEAYNKVGSAVYGCVSFAGPPPAGGTTWIILPKGTNTPIKFLPNCMVQMQ